MTLIIAIYSFLIGAFLGAFLEEKRGKKVSKLLIIENNNLKQLIDLYLRVEKMEKASKNKVTHNDN